MPRDPQRAPPEAKSEAFKAWIRTLHEVTDVLGAARGLTDAAPGILRAVGRSLGWQFGAVWAHDPMRNDLRCVGTWTEEGSAFPAYEAAIQQGLVAPGECLAGRVWDLRWPVWIEDLGAEKTLPKTSPLAAEDGLKTALGIPCLYGDMVQGIVEFARRDLVAKDDVLLGAVVQLGKQIGQFVAREAAVRSLLRSKRDMGDLFENAPVGMHMTDRDGRILRANRAILEILGHTRDEYVGRLWRDFHADPAVADSVLARLSTGDPAARIADLDARLRMKDGSIKWVRINANALWEEGELLHVRAFTSDVTAVKHAEQALRESEESHRRLVEGARDYALHALDGEGRVTAWNSGAHRLYGYEADEVMGKDFALSFTAEDRADEVPSRMLRLAADEGEFQHEGWRVRKDGTRFPTEVVYTALREPTGRLTGISQLTRDISERMRLRALRARSADLELANCEVVQTAARNSEIQQAVAAAVEGPLGSVERAIERAGRAPGGVPTPAAFDGLLRSVEELRRAVRGLDELASASGPVTSPAAQPLDLRRVATETLDMLRDAAVERRVRVEIEVDPSLSDVVVDPTRLRQVAYNLLSNAIKFSRERGRVSLRLLPEGLTSFRLEVEDSGIGISTEEIARVLRRPEGVEAGEVKPGSGLGLRASKQVVEQLGGRLGAQSTPGRGSLFFAVLPRTADRREGAQEGEPSSSAPRERRVIVVSDDVSTRASLVWTLGSAGCEILCAAGPLEAIDAARDQRCEIVAVDLLMEEGGAVDFVATMRGEGASRDAPWILAALGTREAGVAGLLATDLLPRPVPADRLFAALERAGVPRGRQTTILVVDSDLALLRATSRTLDILNYRAIPEPDAHAALRMALEERPAAVIFSPSHLMGLDPFSFLEHLRQIPGMGEVPVLLTVPRTFEDDEADALIEAAIGAAREGRWHLDLPRPAAAGDLAGPD